MKRRLLSIAIFLTALIIIFCLVVNNHFFILQLYRHYNGISFYYIATKLTRGESDVLRKLQILVDYVQQNVFNGHFETQDLPPLENLIRGIGWCDQDAHLYVRLIQPLDIRGYLFFLRNTAGASPHSVAVITPKTKRKLIEYSEIIKEGWVVDAEQGVIFKNKSGQPATFQDIASGNALNSQDKYFIKGVNEYSYYSNEARIFLSNTPISFDNRKRQFFYKYIFPFLPDKVIHIYQNLLLNKWYSKLFKEKNDFLYYKARNYHIYERFSEARKLYETIISTSKDKTMISKCLFFEGMTYFRQKRFDYAKKKFESIIKNYSNSPWFPLAQKWLLEAEKLL
ncbi:MAG: hypothetical protein ISS92_01910 [Candidatus Omnitrophica bacterium]|nr:hypothetical protein [Candidatus Omnitrophota bacterium]